MQVPKNFINCNTHNVSFISTNNITLTNVIALSCPKASQYLLFGNTYSVFSLFTYAMLLQAIHVVGFCWMSNPLVKV